MKLIAKLEEAEGAEEFFALLDVPFEPERLMPVRLHVMKRFADYKEQIDRCHGDADEKKRAEWYQDALARAYEDFLDGVTDAERKHLIGGDRACACHGTCGDIQQGRAESAPTPTFAPLGS